MGVEIERKFLVRNDDWRQEVQSAQQITQGYIAVGPPTAVRVRIADGAAILNIKKATLDLERAEFEFSIPLEEGEAILDSLCEGHIIQKTRYMLPEDGFLWEIDVFEGSNAGLVVAEIELEDVDDKIPKPDWLGEEISDDPRYLNSSLTMHPYTTW